MGLVATVWGNMGGGQWFSSFRMHQNLWKVLLKHRLLDPSPEFLVL